MLEDLIQPLDDVGRKQRKFVLGEMSRCIVVSRNGQHPADRLTGKLQNRDPLDSDGYEMLEAAGRNNKVFIAFGTLYASDGHVGQDLPLHGF